MKGSPTSDSAKVWTKDTKHLSNLLSLVVFVHNVLKPSTTYKIIKTRKDQAKMRMTYRLLTPGLDNTCLFMSLTAGAGTRCMSLLSSSPNLFTSDIPFPWFLMLGCNSQAQDLRSHGGCRIIGPKVAKFLDR